MDNDQPTITLLAMAAEKWTAIGTRLDPRVNVAV